MGDGKAIWQAVLEQPNDDLDCDSNQLQFRTNSCIIAEIQFHLLVKLNELEYELFFAYFINHCKINTSCPFCITFANLLKRHQKSRKCRVFN